MKMKLYEEILKAANAGFDVTFRLEHISEGIVVEAVGQYGDSEPIRGQYAIMKVETTFKSAQSYAAYAVTRACEIAMGGEPQ